MKKKLSRYGNSRGLIIDKAILELLGIEDDTILHIKTDGKVLIIEPIIDDKHASEQLFNHPILKSIKDEKVRRAVAEVMEKHSEGLKELAKR